MEQHVSVVRNRTTEQGASSRMTRQYNDVMDGRTLEIVGEGRLFIHNGLHVVTHVATPVCCMTSPRMETLTAMEHTTRAPRTGGQDRQE